VPSTGIGNITAFTISACEWWQATTNGTVYAQATAPSPTLDQQIKLRTLGSTGTGCTKYAAPDDATSLGGWTTEPGGCLLNNIPGPTYSVLNSTSSSDCSHSGGQLFDDAQNAQNAYSGHYAANQAYIPVYTSVTGSGVSAVYHLLGIAFFVVTGYHVPDGGGSDTYPDWLNSANTCSNSTYCINGYFVNKLVPYAGSFSASSVGLNAVTLSG
jgi:hypothetical protein